MFEPSKWRVHVLADDEQAARALLSQTTTALGVPVELVSFEASKRLRGQWIFELTVAVTATTHADAVFETLRRAQGLATAWTLLGPHVSPEGQLGLELIAEPETGARFSIPGLRWVGVTLRGM